MVAKKVIAKNFENFRGNDLGATELTREVGFSSGVTNVDIQDNFTAKKRAGFVRAAFNPGTTGQANQYFRGCFSYVSLDKDTGATSSEIVGIVNDGQPPADEPFWKLSETNTLTVSSTESSPTFECLADGSEWEVTIAVGGTPVSGWPKTYSDGVVEVNPNHSIAELESDIDAETNWTASTDAGMSTVGTVANIGPVPAVDVSGSGQTFNVFDFEEVLGGQTLNPTLPEEDANFKNASHVNLNDILYFCVNGDYIFKYDGQNIYRAGLPLPDYVSPGAGTGTLSGTFRYGVTFIQKDATGNIIESDLVVGDDAITVSSAGVNVTFGPVQAPAAAVTVVSGAQVGVTTITVTKASGIKVGDFVWFYDQSGATKNPVIREVEAVDASANTIDISGAAVDVDDLTAVAIAQARFNLNSALVNGNQTGVTTITVLTGHSLVAGDTAYFFDRVTDTHVERVITSVTATTIVIPSPAVDVNNDDPISNNLRVGIYRTEDGGASDYFLLAEIPNNFYGTDTNGEQTYTDDGSLDLGAKFLAPLRTTNPPPKATYLTTHQGLMISAGDFDQPNTVFFSEPDNVEAFPTATNSFDIPFTTQGPITGLASDEAVLVVFKEIGRAIVRGELATGNFSVEVIEDGIGCSSHEAIAETPVGTIFPSKIGFQRMRGGRLDPDFPLSTAALFRGEEYEQISGTAITTAQETQRVFKRAVAVNDYTRNLYICYAPTEQGTPGTRIYPNTDTAVDWMVYDYKQDAWVDWSFAQVEINAYGGMFMHKDLLHAVSVFDVGSTNFGVVWKALERDDQYDAADNAYAINMVLPAGWDHGGEPSVYKKFLREKTWQFETSTFSAFVLTIKTMLDFGTATHSSFTQTFSASTTKELSTKLLGGQKARAIQFEFSNNVLYEVPQISGYEYEVVFPYRGDIKE
jgi:hypothetical protein